MNNIYQKGIQLKPSPDILIEVGGFAYLWVLRGSGVRDTLRMGRLLWEGDCCLGPRACCGEPEWGKRLWGLTDPWDG